MRDPKFKNTVVVMLDNDESGAFGLVINKPLASIPLGSLIKKLENKTTYIKFKEALRIIRKVKYN